MAAALNSIRVVYDISDLYDPAKVSHLERPADAERILRELRDQRIIEPFLSQLDPLFDSVVFTSPTEASVLYRVGPSYQGELGRVLVIDGTWRVALGTFCRDLAAAGYMCPGVVRDSGRGPVG